MPDSGPSRPCIRCGGSMEEGYILDRGDGNRRRQAEWVQGPFEPSWLMGSKIAGRATYHVMTRRCTNCGWLDSYIVRPGHPKHCCDR